MIARLQKVLKPLVTSQQIRAYEILFVNDASTDGSLALLLNKQKEDSSIRIINMARNFGVSPCVMAGFDHANGDVVVYMDCDLQDPPELIPEMLKQWYLGFDVVHTVRRARHGESAGKMFITKTGYRLLQFFSDVEVRPNSGDFKLISRRALNEVRRFKEKKPFTRAIVTWVGFKQTYVSYEREARFEGKTKFPVFSYRVLSNFFDSALISFSDKPLKAVSAIGLIVSLVSFGLLVHVLIQKFLGSNIPGWTAIMVTISFIGGIQLVAIGVVGLYVNAIFLESKNRPNYIVSDIYTADPKLNLQAPTPEVTFQREL